MFKAVNVFNQVTGDGEIGIGQCYAIAFKNQGDVTAIINNACELAPGETLSLNQDSNTQDATVYNISFPSGHPLSTGTRKNVCVIRIGKK